LFAYVQAFSPATRDIFERFDFATQTVVDGISQQISWSLCSRIIGCGNTRPLGTLSIQLNENDADHSRIVG
jgi:hypothetical protein